MLPRSSLAWLQALVLGMAILASPKWAAADEPAAEQVVVGTEEPEVAVAAEEPCPTCPPNKGKVTFSLGMDFTTAYLFRGILQERNGFIWQPYGTLGIKLYEGEGAIKNFTLLGGLWNSVQSEQTLASGSGPANWYEADVTAGFAMGLGDYLTTNVTYIAYTYPNGAFPTVQEIDAGLALNDSEWLGAFALNPSMTWAFELDNTAFGDEEGIYLQLNAKPSYTFFSDSSYPLTLALPLTLGLSVSDYYEVPATDTTPREDDTFGFFDVGFTASVPLSFIPCEYGSWSAYAGVDVYFLSDTLEEVNLGDSPFGVGKLGISMTY
jgi:hypothetical protein